MEAVKIHLVATILLVQFASYDRVPYFPTEISRSAASSPNALNMMRIGFTTLLMTLYATDQFSVPVSILWVGLMIVAFVPDTLSLGGHMVGVALIFVAASLQCLAREGNGAHLLGLGVFLYFLRIAMKYYAFVNLVDDPLTPFMEWNRRIMFGELNPGPNILPWFRMSATMQWTAFWAWSHLF